MENDPLKAFCRHVENANKALGFNGDEMTALAFIAIKIEKGETLTSADFAKIVRILNTTMLAVMTTKNELINLRNEVREMAKK